MDRFPRIALGTIQENVDLEPFLTALVEALRRSEQMAQLFCSQSCFQHVNSYRPETGARQRHLDSWLMSPATCRQSFCLGARGSDLSLVFGTFAKESQSVWLGGSLDRLCEWLDLPRILVLDVSESRHCYLPKIPEMISGVILLGVRSIEDRIYWQTYLESHFRVRLMGALSPSAAQLSAGQRASDENMDPRWGELLVEQVSTGLNWKLISAVAHDVDPVSSAEGAWVLPGQVMKAKVAIAYDDAFHCYFPDTLDLLEMQGARIYDFSPLNGDKLPDLCDLVLIGCGRPEHFAEKLSRNVCMQQALQEHVCRGRRVYAEGGGLAYACQSLECEAGRFPMTGLLPAVAHWRQGPSNPTEIRLMRPNWLADGQATIRGYRSASWALEPRAGIQDYCDDPQFRFDIVGHRGVIGSRLLLHFASQPRMLQNLLRPVRGVEC